MSAFFLRYVPAIAVALSTPSLAMAANWLGVDNQSLRDGNVSFSTIPAIILNVTNFVLSLMGTITMIMVIYGAVRVGYGSVSSDKEA